MGRRYVIAAIPTRTEREDYDPADDYRRMADGSIRTIFRCRNGGFGSGLPTVHPTVAVVRGTGNGEWRVYLSWLLPVQYLTAAPAPGDDPMECDGALRQACRVMELSQGLECGWSVIGRTIGGGGVCYKANAFPSSEQP